MRELRERGLIATLVGKGLLRALTLPGSGMCNPMCKRIMSACSLADQCTCRTTGKVKSG
jgi:hypothetical protein